MDSFTGITVPETLTITKRLSSNRRLKFETIQAFSGIMELSSLSAYSEAEQSAWH
jgi:hypothetical protein